MPKLVWLRLSGNPITDFSPLGRLTGMRWLMLRAEPPDQEAAMPDNGTSGWRAR